MAMINKQPTRNVGAGLRKRKPYLLLVGLQTGADTLEIGVGSSYKAKS